MPLSLVRCLPQHLQCSAATAKCCHTVPPNVISVACCFCTAKCRLCFLSPFKIIVNCSRIFCCGAGNKLSCLVYNRHMYPCTLRTVLYFLNISMNFKLAGTKASVYFTVLMFQDINICVQSARKVYIAVAENCGTYIFYTLG